MKLKQMMELIWREMAAILVSFTFCVSYYYCDTVLGIAEDISVDGINLTASDDLFIYMDHVPQNEDGLQTISYPQWTLVYNLADRLFEYSNHGSLEPNLVKSMNVSADGKVYTLKIHSDRKYRDGSQIKAKDVVFSLKLAINNNKTIAHLEDLIDCNTIDNSECRNLYPIGDDTVRITLKSKDDSFIERLNMNELAIRKSGEKNEIKYSGPYYLVEKNKNKIILNSNLNHPYINSRTYKRIVIQEIPSDLSKTVELLRSQHSVFISKGFSFKLESDEGKILAPFAYSYAASNSYLLSLDTTIRRHHSYIKWAFQQAVNSVLLKNSLTKIRPISSFYPPGYSLFEDIVYPEKPAPKDNIKLKVKIQKNYLNAKLFDLLEDNLKRYKIEASFDGVDERTFQKQLGEDGYNSLIAAPYVDCQNEVVGFD